MTLIYNILYMYNDLMSLSCALSKQLKKSAALDHRLGCAALDLLAASAHATAPADKPSQLKESERASEQPEPSRVVPRAQHPRLMATFSFLLPDTAPSDFPKLHRSRRPARLSQLFLCLSTSVALGVSLFIGAVCFMNTGVPQAGAPSRLFMSTSCPMRTCTCSDR